MVFYSIDQMINQRCECIGLFIHTICDEIIRHFIFFTYVYISQICGYIALVLNLIDALRHVFLKWRLQQEPSIGVSEMSD